MEHLTKDGYYQLAKNQYEKAKFDLTRPIYHLVAPGMWMFDINGAIYSGGKYHMFYLHDPFSARGDSVATLPDGRVVPGSARPNRLWAHAVSDDLVSWTHLPSELILDRNKGKLKAISGSALVLDEHRSVLMYTEVSTEETPSVQCIAIGPPSLENVVPIEQNPVISLSDIPIDIDESFRDPFLIEQDGEIYALICAITDINDAAYSCVLLFKADNRDLTSFSYKGILIKTPFTNETDYECPKLFSVGDKWVFFFGPHVTNKYYVVDVSLVNCRMEVLYEGLLDYSPSSYIYINMNGNDGKAYSFGRLERFNNIAHYDSEHWAGCLSVARELSVDRHNRLMQRPIAGLNDLKFDTRPFISASDTKTNAFCVEGKLDNAFKIIFKDSQGEEVFAFGYNGNRDAWAKEFSEYGEKRTLPVRKGTSWSLYVDKKVFELFMYDGITCMTGVITRVEPSYTVEIVGDADAVISSMKGMDEKFN